MDADAIVVGGSFAGLSAALQLARANRPVRVIDAGSPRNRFAAASHGMFGRDGGDPRAMLSEAREQLARYSVVQFVEGKVIRAQARDDEGFDLMLDGGEVVSGRRVILAFGVIDDLPPVPGLAERWGNTVMDCPYCHAYELSGRRLGVLSSASPTVAKALLMADWGPTTFFLNATEQLQDEARRQLEARGVALETEPVVGIEGPSPAVEGVRLRDGRLVPIDALFLASRTRMGSPLAEMLGCAFVDGPFGPLVRTDHHQCTSVEGVYAAGDIAAEANNTSVACADGVKAGMAAHQSLVLGRPE